ncbi:hypothetical protein WJ972_01295 [Achromobacter insuavis]
MGQGHLGRGGDARHAGRDLLRHASCASYMPLDPRPTVPPSRDFKK